MKYFVPAQGEEKLREILESMDLNVEEVTVKEADQQTAESFGYEKGFIIEEKAPDRAARLTRRFLYIMGFKARVKATESEDLLKIEVEGEDLGVVIGKQGQTLQAFQTILSAILNKNALVKKSVYLDIGDYRKKREEQIKNMVEKAVERVKKTRRSVQLKPMPAFERRFVHSLVSSMEGVRSESSGEEPERYVIIYPEN